MHVNAPYSKVINAHKVARWVQLFLFKIADAACCDEQGVQVLVSEDASVDLLNVQLDFEFHLAGSVDEN